MQTYTQDELQTLDGLKHILVEHRAIYAANSPLAAPTLVAVLAINDAKDSLQETLSRYAMGHTFLHASVSRDINKIASNLFMLAGLIMEKDLKDAKQLQALALDLIEFDQDVWSRIRGE